MSVYPEEGWQLLGWKVWYHDGETETVYSSKNDKWLELPAEGVQFMRRYYGGPDGQKWTENISGCDLYAECRTGLPEACEPHDYIKIGTHKTHGEVRDMLEGCRAATGLEGLFDNSIEAYCLQKRVTDWECLYSDGSSFSSLVDDSWDDIPKEGVIMLLRQMEGEGCVWIEQIFNVDLYVVGEEHEKVTVADCPYIKRGLMIDGSVLDDIVLRASVDEEVF
jgi:hypothetical protein